MLGGGRPHNTAPSPACFQKIKSKEWTKDDKRMSEKDDRASEDRRKIFHRGFFRAPRGLRPLGAARRYGSRGEPHR